LAPLDDCVACTFSKKICHFFVAPPDAFYVKDEPGLANEPERK
jgi:hypothetical protein